MSAQFLRFCIVGGGATLLNYALFYLLYQGMGWNYMLASGTGYMTGVFAGYAANRFWTFSNAAESNIFSYMGVYVASLVLSLVALHLLVELVGIPATIANLLVIGMTMITNFIGTKFLVFKV